jgi:tetratricopeptide (TPR) repeat protein
MKDYLTDVLSNKEYSGLQPTAERLMIDYYSGIDDYTNAIERADNLLEKYSNDSSYVCDVLYAKGLILAHNLDKSEEAAECFASIINNYPGNALADLAQNELRILGYEESVKEENSETVSADEEEFSSSNYPNPFNPTTTISYNLPTEGKVLVKVYDVLGREVETLVNEIRTAGTHKVEWNGSRYSSGIYFYSVTYKNKTLYKKMLMVK